MLKVLKIGGSVLTRKHSFCEVDHAAVAAFAAGLARVWPGLSAGGVLVLGGGSFGNAIPERYGFADPAAKQYRDVDLFRMTAGQFGWASTLVDALARHGVPAYPLQFGALVTGPQTQLRCDSLHALARVLEAGLLPVMTGDLVFGARGTFSIVSSDRVPELLLPHFAIDRVVMQSDVAGVLLDRHDPSTLVRRVDTSNAARALAAAGASQHQDVTGGMRTKVSALLRLAERGVRGVLCSADSVNLEPALFGAEPPGTVFEPNPGHLEQLIC